MDWKQFIASVVSSLAWPVAIVIILIVFRVQVTRLLSQIKKIGAGSFNLEVAEQVEKVVSAGQVVEQDEKKNIPAFIEIDPTLIELAKSFPDAAFLRSFKNLEEVILELRSWLPDGKPHRYPSEVLQKLLKEELISKSVVELFNQLQKARNVAVHGGNEELSASGAYELIRQARVLEDLLGKVLEKLRSSKNRV